MKKKLKKNSEIKPDTPLPEEVIESYFVWIPKFKYQLWDLGEYDDYVKDESVYNSAPSVVHEIKIEFNATNTTNINGKECIATNKSNDVGTCKVGDWMTHPAFTNFGVNGFWIGKFESSGVTESVKIKPNVNSLNNISFKTMFDTAYNYKRDLDSHMLKNTEWGAVAYLSHSKYGIGKEVNINNNSKYITGCGAIAGSAESDECNNYTTELGKGASTTGNITGVYDMSGGSGEYVASFLSGVDSDEGFTEEEIKKYGSKYFDIYNFLATHDTE